MLEKQITSSSEHSGLCSATTAILSSLSTFTENIAILQKRVSFNDNLAANKPNLAQCVQIKIFQTKY